MTVDNNVSISKSAIITNQNVKNKQHNYHVNPNAVDKTPQKDTVQLSKPKKEEVSTGTKWGLGVLALAGIGAIAYFVTRGKVGTKQVQQLAEHIEFKEAQNMEEAIKFAKEHFGIIKFDVGSDLEMANWINNGLAKVSNKYKGKAPIPTIVETYPEELYQKAIKEGKSIAMADINAHTGRMRVNTHYFNDAKKTIQGCMDAMGIKIGKPDAKGNVNYQFGMLPFMNMKKQTDLMPLLEKVANGKPTKMEIVTCEMAIGDMLHYQNLLYEQPELIYSHVLKSRKLQSIFDTKKELNVLSLDKFNALTKEKQIDYLYNLNDEVIKGRTGDDLLSVFSEIRVADRRPDVHHVIAHEMGHALHLQSIGTSAYKKEHLLTDTEKNIATTISDYATTNSHEFVAEVFADLLNGKTFSDDVMALYKKYGGPILS